MNEEAAAMINFSYSSAARLLLQIRSASAPRLKHCGWLALILAAVALFIASCSGGGPADGPDPDPVETLDPPRTVQVSLSDAPSEGELTVSIRFDGVGVGPYRVDYEFGTGVVDSYEYAYGNHHVDGPNDSITVGLRKYYKDTPSHVTVYVEDAYNKVVWSGRVPFMITGLPNTPPTLDAHVEESDVIAAQGHDAEADNLRIVIVGLTGNVVPQNSHPVWHTYSGGSTQLHFRRANPFQPGTGTVTIQCLDSGDAASAPQTLELDCPPVELRPDAIYAFPTKAYVQPGEEVTIIVATGPLTHPLHSVPNVQLALRNLEGLQIDPDSINLGAPGGGRHGIDGVWTQINPAAVSLTMADPILERGEYDFQDLLRFNFAVNVQGGSEVVTAGGELFSFNASAQYTCFLDFDINAATPTTYYEDAAGVRRHWLFEGDLYPSDTQGVINVLREP
jgi:hypothetical protein